MDSVFISFLIACCVVSVLQCSWGHVTDDCWLLPSSPLFLDLMNEAAGFFGSSAELFPSFFFFFFQEKLYSLSCGSFEERFPAETCLGDDCLYLLKPATHSTYLFLSLSYLQMSFFLQWSPKRSGLCFQECGFHQIQSCLRMSATAGNVPKPRASRGKCYDYLGFQLLSE